MASAAAADTAGPDPPTTLRCELVKGRGSATFHHPPADLRRCRMQVRCPAHPRIMFTTRLQSDDTCVIHVRLGAAVSEAIDLEVRAIPLAPRSAPRPSTQYRPPVRRSCNCGGGRRRR